MRSLEDARAAVKRFDNIAIKISIFGCDHDIAKVVVWLHGVREHGRESLHLAQDVLDFISDHFNVVVGKVAMLKPRSQIPFDSCQRAQVEKMSQQFFGVLLQGEQLSPLFAFHFLQEL